MLGGGGVLGLAFCKQLVGEDWGVTAVTRVRPAAVDGVQAVVLESTSAQVKLLQSLRPEFVIDLRAFTLADIEPMIHRMPESISTWINVSSVYAQLRLGALWNDRRKTEAVVLKTATQAHPEGPYGEGKLACERLWAAARDRNVRVLSIRLPFVVGRGDRSGRIKHYTNLLATGESIQLPLGGTRQVPLIDARDVARFISRLPSQTAVGTVQVTAPSRPLREHLRDLAAALGTTARIVDAGWTTPSPPPFSYPVDILADHSEATDVVGNWAPTPWPEIWPRLI